jgi:hypothetical protein
VSVIDKIKSWLRTAERERDGGTPVATPPGDDDRETSTNAQVQGAVGQPWSDDD